MEFIGWIKTGLKKEKSIFSDFCVDFSTILGYI